MFVPLLHQYPIPSEKDIDHFPYCDKLQLQFHVLTSPILHRILWDIFVIHILQVRKLKLRVVKQPGFKLSSQIFKDNANCIIFAYKHIIILTNKHAHIYLLIDLLHFPNCQLVVQFLISLSCFLQFSTSTDRILYLDNTETAHFTHAHR